MPEALLGLGRAPLKLYSSLHQHQFQRGRDAPAARQPVESPAGADLHHRPRPTRPTGRPKGELSASLLCQGYPRHLNPGLTGSGESRHSDRYPQHSIPWASRDPKKDSGLLTETNEGASARRGARVRSGSSRTHYRGSVWSSSSSPSGNVLQPRRSPAFARQPEKPGVEDPQVIALRSRRPGWQSGGRVGVCPGRARPRGLRGKFFGRRWGWRPGRKQPRCSWAQPRCLRKALAGSP